MSDIAIIGSGISGLGAALILHPRHSVTVYEKDDYVGGHTRTRRVNYGDRSLSVDTGFIVFNYRNYPNLGALFRYLGVPVQKSVMSFGVTSKHDNLEWGAENLGSLFGQPCNIWRPEFYKFLGDVLKFNWRARAAVRDRPEMSMEQLVTHLKLGDWFRRFYILPMGGAIWSLPLAAVLSFPAKTFVEFFDAHGLLTIFNQPQWYTVTGGSAEYVRRLTRSFRERILTSCGAEKITRKNGKIQITDRRGGKRDFDQLVLACHADEALALLEDVSDDEKMVLSSFQYQKNTAVLHRDVDIMPQYRACWASWIYHADDAPSDAPISVTYWMNHLQRIDAFYPLLVTLNPRMVIAEDKIFERHEFTHPIYDEGAIQAQDKIEAIQGKNNTWFCGSYQGNGFHEDGLVSAIRMTSRMGIGVPW